MIYPNNKTTKTELSTEIAQFLCERLVENKILSDMLYIIREKRHEKVYARRYHSTF
nr:MAG TPA: hypothetical protein [Caudoviricetes sp.]